MKRKEIVYEVRGAAGSYEDQRDWHVSAYRERSEAEAHVEAANREEQRIKDWAQNGHETWMFIGEPNDPRNPYDRETGGDRGHATYYLAEVPVSEKFLRRRPAKLPTARAPERKGSDGE